MATKKNFVSALNQMIENAENEVQTKSENREKDDNKDIEVTINFKIPKSLHTALKIYTAQQGISIKGLIHSLIQKKLKG